MKLTLKHQSDHNVNSEIFKFTIENKLIQLQREFINKQDEMIRLLEAKNLELSKKIESIYKDMYEITRPNNL